MNDIIIASIFVTIICFFSVKYFLDEFSRKEFFTTNGQPKILVGLIFWATLVGVGFPLIFIMQYSAINIVKMMFNIDTNVASIDSCINEIFQFFYEDGWFIVFGMTGALIGFMYPKHIYRKMKQEFVH